MSDWYSGPEWINEAPKKLRELIIMVDDLESPFKTSFHHGFLYEWMSDEQYESLGDEYKAFYNLNKNIHTMDFFIACLEEFSECIANAFSPSEAYKNHLHLVTVILQVITNYSTTRICAKPDDLFTMKWESFYSYISGFEGVSNDYMHKLLNCMMSLHAYATLLDLIHYTSRTRLKFPEPPNETVHL